MLLIDEPGSGRLFVNDMRGPLYTVSYDGRVALYLDVDAPEWGVPVYLEFAPSADDWLVRRVRASSEPQRLAVVTRDRRVGGRAQHSGASVVSPAQFLGLCADD